jgi:hypothetical protein
MTIPGEIIGGLLAANIAVVGYLAAGIRSLGSKLDNMVCDPLCKERSEKCQRSMCIKIVELEKADEAIRLAATNDTTALWNRVNTHRHDDKGRVVIG